MKTKFKIGDKTNKVWSGNLVSECEYIADLGQGRMLFYDVTYKCFRRVFYEGYGKKLFMNGWDAATKPSKLI